MNAFTNIAASSPFSFQPAFTGRTFDEIDEFAFVDSFGADDLDPITELFEPVRGRRRLFVKRGGEFRRLAGRPGGDVGNRKRREYERHDDDFEHERLRRVSRAAARLEIAEALDEMGFHAGTRQAPDAKAEKRSRRRNGSSRHHQEPVKPVLIIRLDKDLTPRQRRKAALAAVSRNSRNHSGSDDLKAGLLARSVN
ncbi:MAG: hypothetical protein AB7W16_21040 [Candidatus Obscuribacterales bacterium]